MADSSWDTLYMEGHEMYKLNGCKLGYTCTSTTKIGYLPKPQNSTGKRHALHSCYEYVYALCELFPKCNHSMNPFLKESKRKTTIYTYIFFLQNFTFVTSFTLRYLIKMTHFTQLNFNIEFKNHFSSKKKQL
jgi:hypothetical protein